MADEGTSKQVTKIFSFVSLTDKGLGQRITEEESQKAPLRRGDPQGLKDEELIGKKGSILVRRDVHLQRHCSRKLFVEVRTQIPHWGLSAVRRGSNTGWI